MNADGSDDPVIVDGIDITAQVAALKRMRTPVEAGSDALPIPASFVDRMQSCAADEPKSKVLDSAPEWIVKI